MGLHQTVGKLAERVEPWVQRRGAVLIVALWACAVLPNLTARSFIWEEGTNAEIGRDVLAHGHFFEPVIYGLVWHQKPSLLGWLIAGIAALTGGVNEWSARLPAMLAALFTALLVQSITRRYASPGASLFAALSFLFCPLLLQKLTIAEPDTVVTFLSFAALLLWWNGAARGRLTILRWIACGLLLCVLALAKGPQPVGFFAGGVGAYLIVERRWRDLPGCLLCLLMPVAATAAWAAIVYRPGYGEEWLLYARLHGDASWFDYVAHNAHNIAQLILELLPAVALLPFAPWPWRRPPDGVAAPAIIAPMLLYSCVCTAVLVLWPGYNSRYAMPIAPSVAVLAGIAWERLGKLGPALAWHSANVLLQALIVYQIVLVTVIMPVLADRFGETRSDGTRIGQAIRAQPAPAFCFDLATNQLFYVGVPLTCLDPGGEAAVTPPAWLVGSRGSVSDFARLRPDLDLRVVVETTSGAGTLIAAEVSERAR